MLVAVFLFVLIFARKLTFLGKKAYARSDWDEQAAAVKNLDGQDLAIFVSYTGETKGILAYARVAQEQQVPMISLISTKGSTLEKNCRRRRYLPKGRHVIISAWI